MKQKVNIFWFRRDLRLHDNHGLYQALSDKNLVLPIFIFDTEILSKLPKNDARVSFIHEKLQAMRVELQQKCGSSIAVFYGKPAEVYKKLLQQYSIEKVFTNRDYEPYAQKRDAEIKEYLKGHGVALDTFKDQVIFEENEVVKDDGNPYVVYTPFMRRWKETFKTTSLNHFPSEEKIGNFIKNRELPWLALQEIGFSVSAIKVPEYNVSASLIKNYENTRNLPAVNGTSMLGTHLRFGTVSIRQMVKRAIAEKNETFWNELIWREFFMQILWHFPHTKSKSFKEKYDRIVWRNNEAEFKAWCQGETGYPIVDAGMRQLNETGYMHNRVRMIVGSFLCKHLLVDWRWGEAYFAEKLLDYEMASNIGNWQWVAGCGVDAAPYFRIFNPSEQIKKFDKDLKYITQWVPELNELTYPQPIVDHKFARERCLKVYKEAVG